MNAKYERILVFRFLHTKNIRTKLKNDKKAKEKCTKYFPTSFLSSRMVSRCQIHAFLLKWLKGFVNSPNFTEIGPIFENFTEYFHRIFGETLKSHRN